MQRLGFIWCCVVVLLGGCVALPVESRLLLRDERPVETYERLGKHRITAPRFRFICENEGSARWRWNVEVNSDAEYFATRYSEKVEPDAYRSIETSWKGVIPLTPPNTLSNSESTYLRIEWQRFDGAAWESACVKVDWVRVSTRVSYAICGRVRSRWLMLTYPAWGLPRDLLDAPVTLLRRLNFQEEFLDDPSKVQLRSAEVLLGGAVVGLPLLVYSSTSPASAATVLTILAVPAGVGVGVVIGVCYLVAAPLVFREAVMPAQNAMLRCGIDSLDYFPNWKFLVWDRRAVLREGAPTQWVIEGVRFVEPP